MSFGKIIFGTDPGIIIGSPHWKRHMIRNKKKDPESGTTTHDDPKLSSVQPDPVEEPDAVDYTLFGRFCSSSTVDEPDDVDNTSSGRN
jgi:hypothetical protein